MNRQQTGGPVEVVAHRGDPVHAVENTLASVRRAIADGALTVEIDVRLTADGVPVLLHDASTERLWGRSAPIGSQTLAEVRELRTLEPRTGREVSIPTLAEAIEAAAGARLLIDLPDPAAAGAAWQVARHAPTAWCGDLAGLQTIRDLDTDAEIWLTWISTDFPPVALQQAVRPARLNVEHRLADESLVKRAAAAGFQVSCWTVDDIERARRLADVGVRAITSNRAAELRTALLA